MIHGFALFCEKAFLPREGNVSFSSFFGTGHKTIVRYPPDELLSEDCFADRRMEEASLGIWKLYLCPGADNATKAQRRAEAMSADGRDLCVASSLIPDWGAMICEMRAKVPIARRRVNWMSFPVAAEAIAAQRHRETPKEIDETGLKRSWVMKIFFWTSEQTAVF